MSSSVRDEYIDDLDVTVTAGSDVDWSVDSSSVGAVGAMYGSAIAGGVYTIAGSNGTSALDWSNLTINGSALSPATINQSGLVELRGENADIVINGQSLMTMMHRIEDRLNILTVNAELESEWEELRALGEQYRALEQQIKDKMEVWSKLKNTDQHNR